MDILSLGLTWWLSPVTSLILNYRYIADDKASLEGEASGINARLMLKLN